MTVSISTTTVTNSYINLTASSYQLDYTKFDIETIGTYLENKLDIGSLFQFKSTNGEVQVTSQNNSFYGLDNSTRGAVFYISSNIKSTFIES